MELKQEQQEETKNHQVTRNLPKFILPKSYRNTKNSEVEHRYSNKQNDDNNVGPIPWRLNKKNSSLMKKIKLYVRTEIDSDENDDNINNDENTKSPPSNGDQQRASFSKDEENAKFVFDTWIGGIYLVIFVAFLFVGYKLYHRYFRRTPQRSTSKIIKEINQNNASRK